METEKEQIKKGKPQSQRRGAEEYVEIHFTVTIGIKE